MSDSETRARFDRGEIDGGGAEREPPRAYRHYAQSEQGGRYAAGAGSRAGSEANQSEGFGGGNFEDLFASIFETGAGRGGNPKGADARYALGRFSGSHKWRDKTANTPRRAGSGC